MRTLAPTVLAALLAGPWALPAPVRAEVPPPAPGVERSRLFAFAPGDRLEDGGLMAVMGGPAPRTEAFEAVRRADGGLTVTSVITGVDDAYRVEARWAYGPEGGIQAAQGQGRYGEDPVTVEIPVTRPTARIVLGRRDTRQTIIAPCDPCLLDLGPSALPLFALTRLYRPARGKVQSVRLIGRDLTQDSLVTEGRADLQKIREERVPAPDGTLVTVSQYLLVGHLQDAQTGRVTRLALNLYVDGQQRPLGLVMAKGGVGLRTGFDGIADLMEPVFNPQSPP